MSFWWEHAELSDDDCLPQVRRDMLFLAFPVKGRKKCSLSIVVIADHDPLVKQLKKPKLDGQAREREREVNV